MKRVPHRPDTPGRGYAATPYLWVLPGVVYLFFFWGYPALYAFYLSLTDASLVQETSRFVGLNNYFSLFSDPLFKVSLRNTGVLMAGTVLLEVSLGLCVALYLYGIGKRFKGILITILLLPWLFSELVSAVTWRWIFAEPFGLLNAVLHGLGFSGVPWLSRSWSAMGAIMLASLWQGVGISAMVMLAALQGVPPGLLDLSLMDGAVGWRRFRYVILPQVKGVLLLDCLLVGIKSLGAFTLVFALTGGGPGHGTEVLASYVYRLTFFGYEPGYASAVGIFLALLFMCLVFLVFLRQRASRLLRPGEVS